MNTIIDGIPIEEGSGNPYADLGHPDADEMLLKAGLVRKVQQLISVHELTTSHAAELLGMPESSLSDLLKGKFRNISRTTIVDCLDRLKAA
jgi:predicted XRE-type DNA-binding protein